MVLEFKILSVSEKRDRLWLKVVLLVSTLFFLGSSIFPLLSGVNQEQPPVSETRVPVEASPVAQQAEQPNDPKAEAQIQAQKQEDLKAQARGLEKLLQEEPGNQTALRELAALRWQLGDQKGAIEPLEKLVQLNPELQVQLALGRAYTTQQRYDEAIAVLDRAIASNEKDFRPVLDKAIVLQIQGKTEAAKQVFAQATELAPSEIKEQIKAQTQLLETPASPPASTNDPSGNDKPQPVSP